MTNDSVHAYAWDADGNPITIGSTSLTYDAFDRMVEQNLSGAYTQFVYSPTGFKMSIFTNGQTYPRDNFVPNPGGATIVYTSSGIIYVRHPDWLGSSRFASTTSSRTMYSDYGYSPFGEPYASSGAIDPSFTGRDQDTTAGLYDFLYREYDPNQARWTQPDPAGLAAVNPSNPQSWNRYAYLTNNPLNFTDPLGLGPCPLDDNGNPIGTNCTDPLGNGGGPGSTTCTLDGVSLPCAVAIAVVQSGATYSSATGSSGVFQVWTPGDCVSFNESDSNPDGGNPNNSSSTLGCAGGYWSTVMLSIGNGGGPAKLDPMNSVVDYVKWAWSLPPATTLKQAFQQSTCAQVASASLVGKLEVFAGVVVGGFTPAKPLGVAFIVQGGAVVYVAGEGNKLVGCGF